MKMDENLNKLFNMEPVKEIKSLSLNHLSYWFIIIMENQENFEISSCGLKARRSASELLVHSLMFVLIYSSIELVSIPKSSSLTDSNSIRSA